MNAHRDARAMRSLLAQVAALGHEIRHYQSADPTLIIVECSCGFGTAPLFPSGAADETWTHGRQVVHDAEIAAQAARLAQVRRARGW